MEKEEYTKNADLSEGETGEPNMVNTMHMHTRCASPNRLRRELNIILVGAVVKVEVRQTSLASTAIAVLSYSAADSLLLL